MRYIVTIGAGGPSPTMPWRAEVHPEVRLIREDPLGTGWGSTPQAAAAAAVEDWRESDHD